LSAYAYIKRMKKKKQKQKHVNKHSSSAVVESVSEEPEKDKPKKNPAAVALGRLGGLKGGKARAAKLTAERRKEIAIKAVRTRWDKRKNK